MSFTIRNFGLDREYDDACFSKLILPEESCQKIINWKNNPSRMFVFCGNPGVGKTYLCACFLKQCIENKTYVRYMRETKFYALLRDGITQYNSYEYELNKIAECDFLILDDLGVGLTQDNRDQGNRQWREEVIHDLLDRRHQNQRCTLITSNLYSMEIKSTYGPRIHSRIMDKRNTIMELNFSYPC